MADDGLVAALARAQMKFAPIVKGHINPHFKSKYADLADVLAAVRPALNAEGIALMQPISTTSDGQVLLSTVLAGHGEQLKSMLPLYLDGMTPQQLLSTLTYYRRGMLAAMLGVAAEDDDDGNAAQTAPPTHSRSANAPVPLSPAAVTGDPYALAAATPPEKPLAAMTAGEMARYGESIGIRVTGSKADILRQLEPYVLAASGEEPFDIDPPPDPGHVPPTSPGPQRPKPDPHEAPFTPTIANAGSVRAGVNSAMKAET